MNIVILYDHLDLALRTNTLLGNAASRASAGMLNVKPWRLDLLIRQPTAPTAMMDASEAHLLILAVKTRHDVPPWFSNWLERWAAQRHVHDAALAIFDGENGNALSSKATPVLSNFASRHGLSFIFGDLAPAEARPPVFTRNLDDLEEREAAQRILLTARPKSVFSYCRGINE